MASNNTVELTRLPNPTKWEASQLNTLKDSFSEHKDVNMWSRNVDINTFRNNENTETGFEKLSNKLMIVQQNQVLGIRTGEEQLNVLDPRKKPNVWGNIKEALKAGFKPLSKAFVKLEDFYSESDIANMSSSMKSFTESSKRFGKGLSEITNGIGAMGPVINTFKTAFNKLVGVWNIGAGIIQFLWATLKFIAVGLFKTFVGLWKFLKNPIEGFKRLGNAISKTVGNITEWGKGLFGFGKQKPEDTVKDVLDGDTTKTGAGPLGTKEDPFYFIQVKAPYKDYKAKDAKES